MAYTLADLEEVIKRVCPLVDGETRAGNLADKSTWSYIPTAEATEEQKAAAQAVIDSITALPLVESHKSMTALEFYKRLTDAEVSALDASTDAVVSAWRARLPYCQMIETDTEESLAMQDYLVSIGLFTSERIAEIFK